MKVNRKFERQGPLYLPRYDVDVPGKRYERYRRRLMPRAAFSFIQGVVGAQSPNGQNFSNATISGVGPHSLLIVKSYMAVLNFAVTITSLTVADNLGNTYTPTSLTPVQWNVNNPNTAGVGLSFLLLGPSGTSTITSTFTVSAQAGSFGFTEVFEFAYQGISAYDKDATAQNGTNTGATPITVPSITPTNSSSLLFAMFNVDSGSEGGSNSPWTSPAVAQDAAYILSSSPGATAANFIDSANPDSWVSLIAAFTPVASFAQDDGYVGFQKVSW